MGVPMQAHPPPTWWRWPVQLGRCTDNRDGETVCEAMHPGLTGQAPTCPHGPLPVHSAAKTSEQPVHSAVRRRPLQHSSRKLWGKTRQDLRKPSRQVHPRQASMQPTQGMTGHNTRQSCAAKPAVTVAKNGRSLQPTQHHMEAPSAQTHACRRLQCRGMVAARPTRSGTNVPSPVRL
jgi:hypothetical protein